MTVLTVFGMVPIYFNRFGDRIQDWDEYGKKTAAKTGSEEAHVFTAYGSDYFAAMSAVGRFRSQYPDLEITRIEAEEW